MIQKVVSPVVVGRAEQLDRLEDALLAANRRESRFVVLAGGRHRQDAPRRELERRANKLGITVLWGRLDSKALAAKAEELILKGFDSPVPVYRVTRADHPSQRAGANREVSR